ncbi:MAG: NAD(P)-dependent oxidoreductase [Thermoproteota archaeon]|nr:NAD(P)-dependent oxidoreductase [Thermoproteota archaeon]
MRVGVAGLGLMGSGIAKRLINKRHKVSVYNRTASKSHDFSDNATIASSPKELAQACDLIITVVTNFDAVKSVLFGTEGVIQSGNRNLVVADVSTISPAQSEYCAQRLRSAGIEMLGVPVMGGPAAAETGGLVPIVAGSRQAFEKVRQVIEEMGSTFYVGERDGSANNIKLALNLNIALIACALSEGITLVGRAGIDPTIFIKILNSTYFKTGLSEVKAPKMIKKEFPATFHLKNMLKDLELATTTAQANSVTLPLTVLAEQMFRAASNIGFSDQDYSAIYAFLARINGLDNLDDQ